ncbi:MAG: LamG domain-containing protein [Opitutales bacterium]|nr:LamG domain-containing protein [Opitutales bacterium]
MKTRWLALFLIPIAYVQATVEIYPFPTADPDILSDLYQVKVRELDISGNHGPWQDIVCLSVKPRPNTTHPIVGGQSSAYSILGDRTMTLAPFGFEGAIELEVTKAFGNPAPRVEVTPKGYGIHPHFFNGQTVRFTMKKWGYVSVNFVTEDNRDGDEAGGFHIKHGLMIFADRPENQASYTIPSPNDPGVVIWNNETDLETLRSADILYFPAGDHRMKQHVQNEEEFLTSVSEMENSPLYHGQLRLRRAQKIYLAPGAYVRGCFNTKGIDNIWLYGRGVVSGRDHLFHEILIPEIDANGNWIQRTATKEAFIDFIGTDNALMEGVIMMEAYHHTCPSGKDGFIKNIKILGFNFNNDGIRPGSGTEVEEIFVKTLDDYDYARGNHTFKNSVIWPMWNGSVGMISWSDLGGSGWDFANNYIINSETKNNNKGNDGVLGSKADFGIQAYDLSLSNVQIEHPITDLVDAQILDPGSQNGGLSFFRDFRFTNIKVDYPFQRTNGNLTKNHFKGYEKNGTIAWVEDMTFTNLVVDGKLVTFDNYQDHFDLNLVGTNGNNIDEVKMVRDITFSSLGTIHKIAITANEGGSFHPTGLNGVIDCPNRTDQSIAIIPSVGKRIAQIVVDGNVTYDRQAGANQTRPQNLNFKSVTADHSVQITFEDGDDFWDLAISDDVFYLDPVTPSNEMSGVRYDFFPGTFSTLPDTSSLSSTDSGTIATPSAVSGTGSASYRGFIEIPARGTYTFTLKHNQIARFWVADANKVVQFDPNGTNADTQLQLLLNPGKYPFFIHALQSGTSDQVEFWWQSEALPFQQIPTTAFTFMPSLAPERFEKLASLSLEGNAINAETGESATLSGSPVFSATGVSGQALILDGVDDALTLSPLFSGNFSVSMWTRTSSPNGTLFDAGNGLLVRLENGLLVARHDGQVLASATAVNNGNWFHWSLTADWENALLNLFVNGTVVASAPYTGPLQSPTSHLCGADASGNYFSGAIDEICIHSYPISQPQVALLHQFPGNLVQNSGFEFDPDRQAVIWQVVQNTSGTINDFHQFSIGVEESYAYRWGKGLQNSVSFGQTIPVEAGANYRIRLNYMQTSQDNGEGLTLRTHFYSGSYDPLADVTPLEASPLQIASATEVHTEFQSFETTLQAPAGVDQLFLNLYWSRKTLIIDNVVVQKVD